MLRYLLLILLSLSLFAGCKSTKNVAQSKPETTESNFPNPFSIGGGTSTSVDDLYVEACTYMMRGDLNSAAEKFAEVLELKPSHHASRYNLARIRLEERDYRAALDLVSVALAADPANLWYRRLLIQVYERQGNLRKAKEEQSVLVKSAPTVRDEYIRLAEFSYRLGQKDEALNTLKDLHTRLGKSPQSLILQYQWLMESNRYTEAVAITNELLADDPANPQLQKLRYQAYKSSSDQLGAEKSLLNWLAIDPKNGEAQVLLSESYRKQGKTSEATQLLRDAFQNPSLDPSWKVAYLENVFIQESGPNPEGQELLNILLSTHPESGEAGALSARMMVNEQSTDSTRLYLRKALDSDPSSFDTWKQLLTFSYDQGRYDLLYDDSRDAREYFPNNEYVLFYYGVSAAAQGQYVRAERALDKISLIEPDDQLLVARALAEQARVLVWTGETESATTKMAKAMALNAKDEFVMARQALISIQTSAAVSNDALKQARRFEEAANNPAGKALLGFVLWKKGEVTEGILLLTQATDEAEVAEWLYSLGKAQLGLGNREGAKVSLERAKEAGADIDVDSELITP
ncbi:MAG: tetratricopeptide repeat protein [Bacteroidia bacterium]|nr:tetratricopeptide repeat protein [Bacteroidia bacterium]